MPGLDHEVHEATRIYEGHRAGCWNKPRTREKLVVKSGFSADGRQLFTEIEDFGSLECRYDQAITPEYCEGCKWVGQGREYVETIMKKGT